MAKAQPVDLTTSEVAGRLSIASRSVLGLIERGHFPNARKLPALHATYLISVSNVERYLSAQASKTQRKKRPTHKGLGALSHYSAPSGPVAPESLGGVKATASTLK